jgi:energy-coupling factor transporter ATP-binding protein EcfA2
MSILITGTPGSGKTSLVKYANQLGGQRFIDADEVAELCEWRDLKTHKVLGLINEVDHIENDAWYKTNGWYWNETQLTKLLNTNKEMILCGSSENVVQCYEHFSKIIILKKNQHQLLGNLLSPERTNPFGKTTVQRVNFIRWQDYLIKESKAYSSYVIEGNDIKKSYKTICELIATS